MPRIKIKHLMRRLLRRVSGIPQDLSSLFSEEFTSIYQRIEEAKLLTARTHIDRIRSGGIYDSIHDVEFKVFSQFGDDGIIQYLITNVAIDKEHHRFIEFGVENYTESNTRFLLINNNWTGLVIDGSKENIDYIKRDDIHWKYDLTALHHFVDKDNINEIIASAGFSGTVGILSIDVDGNDYWLWECITVIDPIIVVVEYNSVLGCKHAVSIPYEPTFQRTRAHYSNLYWGCSLKALYSLADRKGYSFVGSNSNGNNAYFIRNDKRGNIKAVDVGSGYVRSKYRESRDRNGRLSYIAGDQRLRTIEDMPVYDFASGKVIRIKDLPV